MNPANRIVFFIHDVFRQSQKSKIQKIEYKSVLKVASKKEKGCIFLSSLSPLIGSGVIIFKKNDA
jgi:hypothetical protein